MAAYIREAPGVGTDHREHLAAIRSLCDWLVVPPGQGVRGWLRLHEKGGKQHDVPAHHRAEERSRPYVAVAGLEGAKAPLFQSVDRAGRLSGQPLVRRAVNRSSWSSRLLLATVGSEAPRTSSSGPART